jgi:hypothetical protein
MSSRIIATPTVLRLRRYDENRYHNEGKRSMKAKPAENPMGDCTYELENPPFTLSGPLHYENDVHPSFRIDGPHGIIASVFAYDSIEAALERADIMTAALADDYAERPYNYRPKLPMKDDPAP